MRKSDSKPTDPSPKSSAVEFLTFVAATGGETNLIDIRYENENLWLTQKLIAELYGIGVNTVNYHLRKLFSNGELIEASVIRKFRITATDVKSYLMWNWPSAIPNSSTHQSYCSSYPSV